MTVTGKESTNDVPPPHLRRISESKILDGIVDVMENIGLDVTMGELSAGDADHTRRGVRLLAQAIGINMKPPNPLDPPRDVHPG